MLLPNLTLTAKINFGIWLDHGAKNNLAAGTAKLAF